MRNLAFLLMHQQFLNLLLWITVIILTIREPIPPPCMYLMRNGKKSCPRKFIGLLVKKVPNLHFIINSGTLMGRAPIIVRYVVTRCFDQMPNLPAVADG